uniref:DNA oxidative demethylase ALKBH2-like isoform X2 n=1 Tax=Jaculus jaculus TaxID=51337 RepID=UPI001E1B3D55|nr:DNA oxidative demethylase ALKBH2-like isoform X2 [Jaculus jaculus]
MERFLMKRTGRDFVDKEEVPTALGGDQGSVAKRARNQPRVGGHPAGPRWRHIQAEGLDCDYTVLFGKAEADKIFHELEEEVEYFTGNMFLFGGRGFIHHPSLLRGRASSCAILSSFVYKDGCDHIGEHRDDERELAPGSPIASVSFGACRDFLFRHKDSRGKNRCREVEVVRLQLAHGSLLVMNHPTNTHWYHSLPVRRKVLAPRVNLTFRRILPTTKK